jgi:hypothetical protein
MDKKQIYWLSPLVYNDENTRYISKIEKELNFKFNKFTALEKLMEEMEKLNFEIYIVIVSGTLFPEYIDKIKDNNNLYSIPITIIFTSGKKSLEEKIDKRYSKYLEHKFYNPLGIVDRVKDLKSKIQAPFKDIENIISNIKLGNITKPDDYTDCLTFEYLKDGNQLIFPFLYQKIMSKVIVDSNSIKTFNRFLLEKFGENKEIKDLVKDLVINEEAPAEIIAKY